MGIVGLLYSLKASKILILEDEVVVAEDIRANFLNSGSDSVTITHSTQDFVKAFETQKPDLLIVDINIKGEMIGVETVRSIFSHSSRPVIYLTGYENPELIENAKTTSPAAYLLKPFRMNQLLVLADIALGNLKNRETEETPILNQALLSRLSSTEDLILSHVIKGQSSKEVARLTSKSEKTVRNHLTSIYRKLNVKSRAQLISTVLNDSNLRKSVRHS